MMPNTSQGIIANLPRSYFEVVVFFIDCMLVHCVLRLLMSVKDAPEENVIDPVTEAIRNRADVLVDVIYSSVGSYAMHMQHR